MAARNTVTRILITAKDEASGVFNSISGKAKAFAAAIAGYFSFREFKEFVNVAAQFEQAMSGVQAVTRASGEDMQRLTATARELGATTSFSASEAAQAMQFLGMAGFDTNQIIAAMPGTLALAKAGNLDLGAAADIASNALSGFGLSASEMATVADTLAAAAASSNTSVTQLGDAMSYAAPISASLGVDIQTAAAAIGALSDAGIQGSRAGTGLAGVLRQLTNVTKAGEGVLDQYGITLADVDVKTRGLDAVLTTLADAGMSAGDVIKLFGAEAGVAGQVLLNMGGRVRELTAELNNAEGAAQAMADVMADNLYGDLEKLRSALEGLKLSGNALSGVTENLRLLTQNTTTFVQHTVENLDLFNEALADTRADLKGLSDDESIKSFANDAIEYFAVVADVGRNSAFSIRTAFEGTGKTIAAGMAQTKALIKGDFAEINAIGQAWLEDMRGINEKILAFDTERYRSAARSIEQMREQRAEVRALDEQLEEAAAQFDALNRAQNATTAGLGAVGRQSEETAQKLAELTRQYQAFIAAGDLQGAAGVQQKINELKEVGDQAEETGDKLEETGDKGEKAGDGLKKVGEGAKQAAQGSHEATEATQKTGAAMNDTRSVLEMYLKVIGQLKAEIGAYSEAALKAVEAAYASATGFDDAARRIKNVASSAQDLLAEDALGGLKSEFEAAADEVKKLSAELALMEEQANIYGGGQSHAGIRKYIASLQEMKLALAQAKANLAELDVQVGKFNASVDDGTLSLRDQEAALQVLIARAEELGSQQLSGLRSALASVQSQMLSLADSARSTLESIKDELDQIDGNFAAIERRRMEQRRADIQSQLDEAKAAGDQKSVNLLTQALRELARLEKRKLDEAKTREQETRERDRERGTGRTGGSGTAGGSGGALGTLTINVGGKARTVPTTPAGARAIESVLRELEQSASVSP